MSYTIYTNADVDMMESLFNALAAWSSSGGVVSLGPTAGSAIIPYQLFAVGLAIGIITAMIQSMMRGGDKIEIGPVMVSMVLFLVMFVPKTTVIVQSNQTGEMRAVANVPVGAAIPGWFFSSVGQHFASETETLFGMPSGTGVTDQGFGQTLQMYAQLEKAQSTDRLFSVFNKVIGGSNTENIDTFGSLKNYINDCTLEKIEIKGIEPGKVLGYTVQALKYDNTNESTELYLYPTGPQIKDCSAAWTELESAVFSKFTDNAVVAVINDIFSIPGSAAASGETALTRASTNNAALGFNVVVQDLFSASVLRPASLAAMAEHEGQMGNTAGAMALEMNYHSGRITQETAMIGKGFAWRDMMLHLMTFAEVVFYGVLPMMALFIAAGALGLKTFSKFMVLGIWIQMWAPMMSLVDFYIDFQAKDMMQAVADTLDGSGSLSISQLAEAADVTQKALSTGYSFMPMIPILSLFILTGSMMAATRVFDGGGQAAGAMGAAAALSPKNEAFGAQSDGKGGHMLRNWQQSAAEGYHAFDSAGSKDGNVKAGLSLPEITFGSNFGQSYQQAVARSDEASQTLNGSMNTAWQSAQQMGATSRLEQTLGQGLTHKSGENFKWADSLKQDLMQNSSLGAETAEQLIGKMSAGMQAGVGGAEAVLGSKFGADLTASMTDQEKSAFEERLALAESQATEASKSEGYEADYGSRFAEAAGVTFADTESSTLGHTISDQAAEVQKASESEQEAQSAMQSVRADNGVSVGELMEHDTMEKMRALKNGLSGEELEEFNDRYKDHFEAAGMKSNDEATKNAWAMGMALMDVDPISFANTLNGSQMEAGYGRDDNLNVEEQPDIKSPDQVAPDAGTSVVDETGAAKPALLQEHQEAGAEARNRYEGNKNELEATKNQEMGAKRAGDLAEQMENRQVQMLESDRALATLDGDSLAGFVDQKTDEVAATFEGISGGLDAVAKAYDDGDGSVFDATVAAMDMVFGDGISNIVQESQTGSLDDMVANIHDHFASQDAIQGWTPEQQELFANYGTAKVLSDMMAIQSTLEDGLSSASEYTPGGRLLDPSAFSEALAPNPELEKHLQEFSGAAGHNFADIQKDLNANGFGDHGPALLQEVQVSAAKSDPSQLVTQYNQAMENALGPQRDRGPASGNNR